MLGCILRNNKKLLLTKEIPSQIIYLNLRPNSILALVILIVSTFSHPILSLINVL